MKKHISTFISYAHADNELATQFINELKEMLLPSAKHDYVFWQDKNILPGENWHQEIQSALNRCTMGVLLISPAFLGSKYIFENELPLIINRQGVRVIPVMLK